MILDIETAKQVAKSLLQIKAIILNLMNHLFGPLAGTLLSTVTIEISLSHSEVRTFIRQFLVEGVISRYGKPDVIAGVATGALYMVF